MSELYIRDGSRFRRVDAAAPGRAHPPIPAAVRVPDVDVDDRERTRPQFTAVPAPRCPHGHFARWARAHCRPCTRQESFDAR